ncbi:hypothetical protein GZL_00584 [Streptomyces sp. 769]|nr:hypothetical protein GZL_00584 [Streptomyces sp. 769]
MSLPAWPDPSHRGARRLRTSARHVNTTPDRPFADDLEVGGQCVSVAVSLALRRTS